MPDPSTRGSFWKKFPYHSLLGAISAVFFISALYVAWVTYAFVSVAQPATAKVSGYQRVYSAGEKDMRFRTTYAPEFAYNVGNKDYVKVSATSAVDQPLPLGHEVAILYDPNDPREAHLDTFFDVWGGAVGLAVFSLFTFAMAVGVYLLTAGRMRLKLEN